jgi:hypothetical protein
MLAIAVEAGGGSRYRCREAFMSETVDFRQFYRNAHAVPNLSEREKMFMGLAVAMVRNCQP